MNVFGAATIFRDEIGFSKETKQRRCKLEMRVLTEIKDATAHKLSKEDQSMNRF
jgi:hypothetical protein